MARSCPHPFWRIDLALINRKGRARHGVDQAQRQPGTLRGQSSSAPGGTVGVGRFGGGAANGIAMLAAKISSATNATTSNTTIAATRMCR
jgi:hypothetical protein